MSTHMKSLFFVSIATVVTTGFLWRGAVSQISLGLTVETNCSLFSSTAGCFLATSINTALCNLAATNESVRMATSCMTDCVCTHNGTEGHCDSASGGSPTNLCTCANDPTMNATTLTTLRQSLCTQSSYDNVIGPELCSDAGNLVDACNQDCKCGHRTKGGQCVANGTFTANGMSWGRCACQF